MLPRSSNAQSSKGNSRGSGLPYLKNEHLTTQPKAANILAVRSDADGKYGPQVVLKLALDGQTRFWTINIEKNPNYNILTDKFGYEENDWTGKAILLALEQDEFSGSYFPRVSFPATKGAK